MLGGVLRQSQGRPGMAKISSFELFPTALMVLDHSFRAALEGPPPAPRQRRALMHQRLFEEGPERERVRKAARTPGSNPITPVPNPPDLPNPSFILTPPTPAANWEGAF